MATHLFSDATPGEAPVRGFLHRAAGQNADFLVLTHGVGGNANAPLLVTLANAMSESGVTVLRCDLPFRQRRPGGPPSPSDAKPDQEGLRRAVALMKQQFSGRAFLGGVSYGGRQATMLVSGDPTLVSGLLPLSYPLHPPGRPERLRTAHFPALQTPSLFVSGTRDGFGSIDELSSAIRLIPARTRLVPVEGGGHGLLTKSNKAQLPGVIIEAFQAFFE
jgi:predicted alpha/beta-hydrolase family hydrolase